MSFRTDGFEPSAYTIPPPRPSHDQLTGTAAAGPIILPQPLQTSLSVRPPGHTHLTRVSP